MSVGLVNHLTTKFNWQHTVAHGGLG